MFTDVQTAFQARYLVGSTITAAFVIPSETRRQIEQADAISRGSLKTVNYGPIESQVFNTALFIPTQTAYVLALHFDLLPQHLRPLAVAELVTDLKRRDLHLSTGFVGSSYLPHVLSNNGQLDTAYQLLYQKSWPSWLYSVTQGATTIWERWDGWTNENGFQSPEMNSFNHYAYGAIGAWLYNTVAGIELDPTQPGYKHSILRANPGGGLTYAKAQHNTPYGLLASHWKLDNGNFYWEIVVPPNTTATVYLPMSGDQHSVTMNSKSVSGAVHDIQSGRYQFVMW